jgi:hypothetical protein
MKATKLLKQLKAIGMTLDEIDAYHHLALSAGRILALPTLHPMEREEVCHDIHVLQNRLLARPGLRALGWPIKNKGKLQ